MSGAGIPAGVTDIEEDDGVDDDDAQAAAYTAAAAIVMTTSELTGFTRSANVGGRGRGRVQDYLANSNESSGRAIGARNGREHLAHALDLGRLIRIDVRREAVHHV